MAVRTITTKLALDGEKEFKREMGLINSEMRTLKSEMALVQEEFRGQANTLDALTEKDRILRKEHEQQEEKVRALRKAVEDAAEAYGDVDRRTDDYRRQLNSAEKELIKLDRELQNNDKYLDEAKNSADQCASSIDKWGKEVKDSVGDVEDLNDAMGDGSGGGKAGLLSTLGAMKNMLVGGAIGIALKEVGEKAVEITRAGAEYADEVMTMSSVTGLSTETLQEYKYMADLVDVSVDTITGSLTRLTRNMESARDGTGAQAEAFEKLGIKVVDADGNLRDAREVFDEVIDALGNMTNETERDATAMDIMGKSAQDLNPLIEAGSEKLNEFRQEAHDMGAVLDDETLGTLVEVQDSFDRLDQQIQISKNKLAMEFAPAVIKICDDLIAAWDKVTNAVITAWNWLNKPIGNTPAKISNTTVSFAADEEFYGYNNSYLDDIKNGKKNGSHAGGLDYVPFDGYIAELHRGEAVLTAAEASALRALSADLSPRRVAAQNASESLTAPFTAVGGAAGQKIQIVTQVQLDKRIIGEAVTEYQIGQERMRG